ncbi:serine/threonine-protein phosphatase 6 regulatory ankyrin repeat subunit C-like isoform X2 [Mya arenaria]|uniref:serine/threonine-protein phosphatase 6 regulatory ankyrin repeat subunit C-like isoform X2 n=1 Tax=Mya arenaria TaxID=6604 RepID=UPI0022E70DB9|nr:serine/threonine-protein phosphatase 6 regulatory ankyrin repeat subunit C-like isoform X2 [Mya arenaria]XP_052777170.1 serine/threonine-protein phosphatase 6 regulatory ankyrin repeat subunit C-like isoform X2 [Mya arenaria]
MKYLKKIHKKRKVLPDIMSHTVLPVSPPPIPKRLIKTALHQAVLDARLHQVRLLVEKHGVNVNIKDVYGRTPLMLTSMIDEEAGAKMAKIFITAGSNVGLKDKMGRTALSMACMAGREKIVDEILRKDILYIDDDDNDGNTPLHHAAASGNPNIVKLLSELYVKFGLDIDVRNNMGYTGLLVACRNGHFVSAHYLLTNGQASPALRDEETYLSANEWAQKSSRQVALPAKRLPSPPSAPAFSRESTMYQRPFTPICKHTTPHNLLNTWARGLDDFEIARSETFYEGQDARQLVLNEISNAEAHGWAKKQKPVKIVHPSTAKLMAFSRRRTKSAIPPDMTTIFRMYSDQYQPDWRRERTTVTLHASSSDTMPSIIRTASSHRPSMKATS